MCILSKNACRHCMYESFLLAARCIQWFHIVHILDYGEFKQIPVKLWAIYSLGPVSIIRECSIGIMPSVCVQIAIQAVQTFQLLSAITAKYSFYIRQLDIQQSTWVHEHRLNTPVSMPFFFREKGRLWQGWWRENGVHRHGTETRKARKRLYTYCKELFNNKSIMDSDWASWWIFGSIGLSARAIAMSCSWDKFIISMSWV